MSDCVRFEDYQGLARQMAGKVYRRLRGAGCAMEFDDVMQEVCLSFAVCARNFDPQRGFKFSTYFMRSGFNNLNRWVEDQIAERHVSLDAENDDGYPLHVTIASNEETAEIKAVAQSTREHLLGLVSENTRQVIELVESPPQFLIDEMDALRAKSAWGKEQGLRHVAAPVSLSVHHVIKFLGLSQNEEREVKAEIDWIMRKAS
jgi:DNA-directed RNA polymerase specialized sigma24 family protein